MKKTLSVEIDLDHWENEFPDETKLTPVEEGETARGFGYLEFKDRYNQICSIQNSSLATECAIWLGVINTGVGIKGPTGQYNEKINARMHLTRKQVEELLPILHEFVETGSFSIKNKKQK